MSQEVDLVAYSSTGYFSKLVADYLSGNEFLKDFYVHPTSLEGIKASINARKKFNTNRELLVEQLAKQYEGIPLNEKQYQHLHALLNQDTFTITTAHQPNIFTGPLYFIYKIIHVIKLADELKESLPHFNFVPVYYMGSEDADLDELGYINLGGEKLVWQTNQTGAVGRMLVDKELLKLINRIQGQIGVLPFGNELIQLFASCYSIGKSIQQATLELVNALFAHYGLLVVIPDNRELKDSFSSVIEKEIKEQFSQKAVNRTIEKLNQKYKVQAGGRELNLFYLLENKRERIQIIENDKGSAKLFSVPNLEIVWSLEEVLKELSDFPERFSANVILRGVFQETILPNIAFVGGGGELAYWLELKNVFSTVSVPYPVLILRNSFMGIPTIQVTRINKLGLKSEDLFLSEFELIKKIVTKKNAQKLSLSNEMISFKETYEQIKSKAALIDVSLLQHIDYLENSTIQRLIEVEKKFLRSEKRKFLEQEHQINSIKNALFPNNNLQERVDNFSLLFAKGGFEWLQSLYNYSKGLEQMFTIVKF